MRSAPAWPSRWPSSSTPSPSSTFAPSLTTARTRTRAGSLTIGSSAACHFVWSSAPRTSRPARACWCAATTARRRPWRGRMCPSAALSSCPSSRARCSSARAKCAIAVSPSSSPGTSSWRLSTRATWCSPRGATPPSPRSGSRTRPSALARRPPRRPRRPQAEPPTESKRSTSRARAARSPARPRLCACHSCNPPCPRAPCALPATASLLSSGASGAAATKCPNLSA
mmetsp:Transcript_10514/g.26636  ORF Transcript_10514/g.26636 Transcript_10514/m.26636 type:complete len:227 (+) Transcript_10514:448-1128(+)